MTCCAPNIVGALLLMLAAAVVVASALVGLVLLTVGLIRRRRGRSAKAVLRTAAGFGAFAVGLPIVIKIVLVITGDPRVLTLDLRAARPVEVLDTEEFPGFDGVYQLDSPRIDLELPDGRTIQTSVSNTVFRSEGDQIEVLTIRGPAEDRRMAADRVRRWAVQLDANARGLDLVGKSQDEDWLDATHTSQLVIEVSLQSIPRLDPETSGRLAIARAEVRFTQPALSALSPTR